ncbi:DNA adenine methylase [Paraprevotella clara]|uniref:DNA adenine methylase n=1 Tax=Paraprevotella clara TaxID=454154 RepID=UPI003AF1ADA0
MAKPFIKWAGGKTQLLTQFENILPHNLEEAEHFTYIEPFVGGGAMLFHMLQKYTNIGRVIINDINPNLITAYRVIRDTPERLITDLKMLQREFRQNSNEEARKEYFLRIRKSYNEDTHNDVTNTAMFIFLNRTCFNGLYRVNSKGYFNVPFGKYTNPTICDEELLLEDSKILQNVEILCGDYTLIERYVDNNTFIYFDPPYRPLSTTSSFTSYSKENFDDTEQTRLAHFFARLSRYGCKMMLSNSDCCAQNPNDTFFENLYGNFIIDKVHASRFVNAIPSKRGKLTESLVRNY